MTARLPDNENERLAALHEHELLDTAPEEEFDDLVRLAAHVCGVPIAAVSLIDEHRQWFKAVVGLDALENSRDVAFCAHTILGSDLLVVPDSQADSRFADNPLVTGELGIRFYAGMPLVTEEGYALGSLCVIDRIPHVLTSAQKEILSLLARQVESHLRAARRLTHQKRLLAERETLVAEKEILATERLRLAAIVESSEDAILGAALDGTLAYWNAGAERLYGYTAAEMLGRDAAVFVDPGETSPLPAAIAALARGDTLTPTEVRRTRKDGSLADVSLSFSPIRNADEEMVGVSCIARDITDKKRAEAVLAETNAALAESEQRMRRLTEAAFEGIAVTQDGVLKEVSPAFASMFGYDSPDQMLGLSREELTAPEALPTVAQKIATGDEKPYEATLLRQDGSTFPAELRGRQIQLGGRLARVTAVRDISEHKIIEEERRAGHSALEKSQARLAQAQRIAKVGSWEYDPVGGSVTWSSEMFRLLGRDPEAGVPEFEAATAYYHPEDAPRLKSLVAQATREGIGYEMDLRGAPGVFGAGPTRWYHTTGEIVLDDAGRVVRLMGTMADITGRKQTEEDLRASHQALQESQARLAEAQRVAQLGSWEFEIGTGQITWSDELFRLFGLEPADKAPSYAVAVALYHPEDAPKLDALVTRAIQKGIGYTLDLRGAPDPLRGGAYKWYHTVGTVVQDAAGSVVGLMGTLADITERKRTEEERQEHTERLRQSEAALRAVLESAPIILFATDADGTVTLSEGTGLAALGLKPGDAVGRSVFDFSGDAEAEDYACRALAGECISYDARMNGLCLHIEIRPVRDAAGMVTGIIGVCFDVTERTRSEERFRVLFEQSSDAHLLFDEGGIIDCNPAAAALLRCSDITQVLSLHPAVLSPEFQPDGRRSDEKCLEMDTLAHQNGFHRFEWTHRKMDGTDFPVEVTLTPVTLGERPVLLVVWHDLSERKRAEQQFKDYAIMLELQKSQLEQANAQLADLATTDGLTGLKNHRTFRERLADEVSCASRYGPPLSVVLLDIDHFKQYNDTYGHPAGDGVLKAVASILQSCARDTDIVARYGGEEFVLILPQTDEHGAAAFAERLRVSVESHPWPLRAVTASFGVAVQHLGGESEADLVARADRALYQSKAAGRNCVTCAAEPALSQVTPLLLPH
jgi:diguanylate cyclase (GGDEF)-like protein/PAS domain S-box-containing protein